MICAVSVRDPPEILLCPVAPPALAESKGEFRRNIAPPDDFPELLHHRIGCFPIYHIEVQICLLAADLQNIGTCIADIKGDLGGMIHKQAKILFSRYHDEVVGAVQGLCALHMVRVVRGMADVAMSPLVDPPDCLAQPIDDIILGQLIPPAKAVLKADRSEGRGFFRLFYMFGHGLRLKGMPVLEFPNHSHALLSSAANGLQLLLRVLCVYYNRAAEL